MQPTTISVDVTTSMQAVKILGRKYLVITVGTTDVLALPCKEETPNEAGKYFTLKANTVVKLKAEEGYYHYLLCKTASGTSTLSIIAGDDELFFIDQYIVDQAGNLSSIKDNSDTLVSQGVKPTWAKGTKRKIPIAATAGNVGTNLAPASGKRWLVLRVRLRLQTDATGTNRTPIVAIYSDGDAMWYETTTAIGASTSQTSYHTQGYLDATRLQYAIPKDCVLDNATSDQITISISNGQAGDSYSGAVEVIEVDV